MKKFFKSLISLNPKSITFYMTLFILILFLISIPILDLIELKSYDFRLKSRGIKRPSPDIVLAAIDEKSLDLEGKWPWPRKKIARLIEELSSDAASVIGFDIWFTEPDENSRIQLLNELDQRLESSKIKDTEIKRYLEELKMDADNDLALATALRNSGSKVVLGYFFHMEEDTLTIRLTREEIQERLDRVKDSVYPLVIYEDPAISSYPLETAYAPESNLEILHRAADASSFLNKVADVMDVDKDGIMRSMLLIIKCGEDIYMPLAVQVTRFFLDIPQPIVEIAAGGVKGIRMGDRFIPTDEEGRMLINYMGPEKSFPYYSATDILQKKLPKGTFEGKIVIIGGTALGMWDTVSTPFAPTSLYPGPEIHANIINSILTDSFLYKPSWALIYDMLAIIILGLAIGVVVPRLNALKGILFAAGLFFLHIALCTFLFLTYGLWINIVYPLLALSLTYITLNVYHYLIEEKGKRFLHATFSSYLSPELIDTMVANETMPELGGEARLLTAYFTDIQGFSVFSEKLSAPQLVELLNEYLSVMTDILIREGGTLDKYEGDAIVAFLGAPMPLPDHPLRACKAAVAMQGALVGLCNKWKNEKQLPDEPNRNLKNLPPKEWIPGDKWPKVVHDMKMRIGINSGDIVIGNMGSTIRMNYTMMGDPVNLAARLEQGAKQFGIYTAVSENTLNLEYLNEQGSIEKAMDLVEARFIDKITVVGKSEPVKIYELCAMKGGLSDKEKELFNIFDQGVRHYQRMDWNTAIGYFKKSYKIERNPNGNTTPSEVYLRRCLTYKKRPPVSPGEKWDGVFRMAKK